MLGKRTAYRVSCSFTAAALSSKITAGDVSTVNSSSAAGMAKVVINDCCNGG